MLRQRPVQLAIPVLHSSISAKVKEICEILMSSLAFFFPSSSSLSALTKTRVAGRRLSEPRLASAFVTALSVEANSVNVVTFVRVRILAFVDVNTLRSVTLENRSRWVRHCIVKRVLTLHFFWSILCLYI